jgi:hypothetical protein
VVGRLDGVFAGSPERTVVRLLRAWWGIECAAAPDDASHPPILHQLWDAGAHRLAWGHQDILLPPDGVEVRDDGGVDFFVENQSCWRIAYAPDGGPDPQVAALVDGKERLPLGIGLHEFLARTLVIEAVFGAAWWTSGELVAGNEIDRWLIWPELIVDPDTLVMPALYSDVNTVCFAFHPHGPASAFYGAATREEMESAAFADLGNWFEPEQSSGPRFAPG